MSPKEQAQAELASLGSLVPPSLLDCEWDLFGACYRFLQATFLESQRIHFSFTLRSSITLPPKHLLHHMEIIWFVLDPPHTAESFSQKPDFSSLHPHPPLQLLTHADTLKKMRWMDPHSGESNGKSPSSGLVFFHLI